MKATLSLPFKCKKLFMNPCKKLLRLFKFKKPLFIRSLHTRRKHKTNPKPKRNRFFAGLAKPFLRSSRDHRAMDRVMELKSFSDSVTHKAPCPSPLTPAYIKMHSKGSGEDDVEDACRSFENYLVEMIVEEGKTKDLADVEELLYCWNNLKCPVFTGLVCRFYGELCKDLFSNNNSDDVDSHK